jgi:hypothetical protein
MRGATPLPPLWRKRAHGVNRENHFFTLPVTQRLYNGRAIKALNEWNLLRAVQKEDCAILKAIGVNKDPPAQYWY